MNIEDRFWNKIKIDDKTECWNWLASSCFFIGLGTKVKPRRFAWKLKYGQYPIGQLRNICGNRDCANPDHCFHNTCAEDRFWEKVDKVSENGCWIFMGFTNWGDYGMFKVGENTLLAHRYSYMIHNDDYNEHLNVLHRCDVRNCVNPKHLYQGTNQDNTFDRMKRGRNNLAILKEKEVLEIRRLSSLGVSGRLLAKIFGVTASTAYKIINRKSWLWI